MLKQLALDEGHKFPLAAKAIEDFYVDDGLTGSDDLETLIDTQRQLQSMFATAGLSLSKYASNEERLLSLIPVEQREKKADFLSHTINDTIKTLGVSWNPSSDCYGYRPVSMTIQKTLTRRIVSLFNGSLYDPMGLFSPVIICAKIMLQELWSPQLEWDTCRYKLSE